MTNRIDTFNRANAGSLGTPSDAGSDWASAFANWGINSNVARSTATGIAWEPAVLESSVTAVEVQATLTALTDGNNAGLCGRYANENNYLLLAVVPGGSGTIKLYKNIATTFTQLGSTYTGSIVTTDVFKLRMDSANLLTCYQNGVSRVSATDATGSANTNHGIVAFDAVSWDTFSITAITAGSALGADFYRQVAGLGG